VYIANVTAVIRCIRRIRDVGDAVRRRRKGPPSDGTDFLLRRLRFYRFGRTRWGERKVVTRDVKCARACENETRLCVLLFILLSLFFTKSF